MAQTQRIARSYLTELISMTGGVFGPESITEHLIAEAASVDYQPRRDRLVLTFDLADEDTPIPHVPADDAPQAD